MYINTLLSTFGFTRILNEPGFSGYGPERQGVEGPERQGVEGQSLPMMTIWVRIQQKRRRRSRVVRKKGRRQRWVEAVSEEVYAMNSTEPKTDL